MSTRSTEFDEDRVVEKFQIKFGNSPVEKPTRKESAPSKKPTTLVFEDDMTGAPSNELSQKTVMGANGGETLPDRDITDYEWAMQYIDSNKNLVSVTAWNKGYGQIAKERPFMYGRLLQLDYEDPDFLTLILLVDCSKGVHKMYVSEDFLVKEACEPRKVLPESLRFTIESTDNLITTLQPYIQGHINMREASWSQQKQAPRKVTSQSRPPKKKVTKMSESEDSSSTEEEDHRSTLEAELASGILSSDQNKIRKEIMQKKFVRKGQVFNLPIISIHRLPMDAKTGRTKLEIREPHKLHVQNLKKKMKINPHAIVVPFIVMVDPKECASVQDFDVRKHDQYNYFVIGGSHTAQARRQLVREHPTTYFFKYAECKMYVRLTTE